MMATELEMEQAQETASAVGFQYKLPAEQGSDFQRCLKPRNRHLLKRPYIPDRDDLLSSPLEPRNRCYASFGDNGTTCSVNTYGDMMQITRFLGIGTSGLYIVDQEDTTEPFFTYSRALDLDAMSRRVPRGEEQPQARFGLQYAGSEEPKMHSMEFLYDRWPRIKYSIEGRDIAVQSFIKDHVVIQQYMITPVDKKTQSGPGLKLIMSTRAFVRDLDYNTGINEFNEHRRHYVDYTAQNGPYDYSHVVAHKLGIDAEGSKTSWICLVMALFVNNVAQKWPAPATMENDIVWEIDTSSTESITKDNFTVTAAYKMIHLETEPGVATDWQSLMISAAEADLDDALASVDHERVSFSKDPKIDFFMRRNVEHLLSVCSIPLNIGPSAKRYEYLSPGDSDDCPIALTLGDLIGHRIHTPTTFISFKFLVSAGRYLRKSRKNLNSDLLTRIISTCRRHLKWVFGAAMAKQDGFASYYWPSGDISATKATNDVPATTPFHLIKIHEFLQLCHDESDFEFIQGLLTYRGSRGLFVYEKWLERLVDTNKRKAYVWKHTYLGSDDGAYQADYYRLDENILIWKALHTLEQALPDHGVFKGAARKDYKPAEVRRHIVRRFTVENESLKTRMLAVTRSVLQTRFLFHARDILLFYGSQWEFFGTDDDPNAIETWQNTIACQKYLEENQELSWDNSLRYVLAVLTAQFDKSIALTDAAKKITSETTNVLYSDLQDNGLFLGQSQEMAKLADFFNDDYFLDSFFYSSFKIPLILWDFQAGEPVVEPDSSTFDADTSIIADPASDKTPGLTIRVPTRKDSYFGIPRARTVGPSVLSPTTRALTNTDLTLTSVPLHAKKNEPFSHLIDIRNIVEFGDEWLYNYPEFLDFQPQQNLLTGAKEAYLLKPSHTVARGAKMLMSQSKKNLTWTPSLTNDIMGSWIIDTRKSKRTIRKEPACAIRMTYTHTELWRHLRERRTAETAKKRFIYLPVVDPSVVCICFLATHESEQYETAMFFDRHSYYEQEMYDETRFELNSWVTEVHLSFYHLVRPEWIKPDGGSKQGTGTSEPIFGELSGLSLVRGCAGFRFTGDFHDRYWTLILAETGSRSPEADSEALQEHYAHAKKGHWRQRKVLELNLFGKILQDILSNTDMILNIVDSELTKNRANVTAWSAEYFSSLDQWQNILNILRLINESLKRTTQVVRDWEDREKERGAVRPRWTKNDERKYRRYVDSEAAIIARRIRLLAMYQERIQYLIQSVSNVQDTNRNELQLRGSENVRLFTYITIIFLPLSFSASIFSMGQRPDHIVIVSMAVTAVIALILTIIILFNVQNMVKVGWRLAKSMSDHARKKKARTTLNWRRQEERMSKVSGEVNGIKFSTDNAADQIYRTAFLPHAGFWLQFMFLEVPARRIAKGWWSLSLKAISTDMERDDQSYKTNDPKNSVETRPESRIKVANLGPTDMVASVEQEDSGFFRRAYNVIVAILCIPTFCVAYITRLILLNLRDFGKLRHRRVENKEEKPSKNAYIEDLVNRLTDPRAARPLLHVNRRKKEPETPTIATPIAERSDPYAYRRRALSAQSPSLGASVF